MGNKYNASLAVLLNNGTEQILPISKAKLIELANADKTKFSGYNVDNALSVQDALTYLLNKGNSDLETAKSYTSDSINGLNSTITADNGYVFGSITEAAGKLTSYNQIWLDASVVSYNGNSNVKSAIEGLQATLAGLAGDGEGSVQTQITNAIQGLDKSEMTSAGKAIISVSETDGLVTATPGNIDAQYVDVDNSNNKFNIAGDSPATTLSTQATLEHLQTEIDAAVGDAARYTINKVTTDLPATVGARYQLMQSINGGTATAVAETIDIPADSTLVEVYLGANNDTVDATTGTVTKNSVDDAQSMNFVHKLANGTYSITKIDISKFFTQAERGNGIVKTGSTIAVGLDASSEEFLTVESDGIKLSGVQSAINTAEANANAYTGDLIAGLDSEIAAKTENNFSYVMTGVTETDGKLTAASYIGLTDENVKTTTFNSESGLYKLLGSGNLPTNLHDALNKIANKISDNGGNAVTSIIGDNDNTYVKISAAKDGNNVTLTVDDSALGNVSKLQYEQVASWNGEVANIFNPEA